MAEFELVAGKSQIFAETTGNIPTASFNINQFKAKVGNIVRPNLFYVKFGSLPSIFSKMNYTIDGTKLADFGFRCERAEMPGKTIATIDETGVGPTLKLPYDVTFSDLQFTVICSEDMFERRFFESWIDEIVATKGNHGIGGLVRYYDEFATHSSMIITASNSEGKRILSYKIIDTFPIALSPMTLAWEETNTYQRFTVTMTYRYHVMIYPEPVY